MSALNPDKPQLGSRDNPWDDVWFRDTAGNAQSIRDIGGSGGGGADQPFSVDSAGDVVLDPDRVIGAGSAPASTPEFPGYMDKSYQGNDKPGVGDNTLINGYSRVWMNLSGRVYLVSRIANLYFLVEMTRE